jgi:hypothetical protein
VRKAHRSLRQGSSYAAACIENVVGVWLKLAGTGNRLNNERRGHGAAAATMEHMRLHLLAHM